MGASTLCGIGPCNLSPKAKIGIQYLNANNSILDTIFVHTDLGEGQGHLPELV